VPAGDVIVPVCPDVLEADPLLLEPAVWPASIVSEAGAEFSTISVFAPRVEVDCERPSFAEGLLPGAGQWSESLVTSLTSNRLPVPDALLPAILA